MAHIIGLSGPVKGQKFDLAKDRTTIGRNPGNDIVLADEAVSSQHCYIARRGEEFVVRDLNSTNGTVLNFERIADEAVLKPKQVLQIGSCEFLFDGAVPGETGVSAPVTQVLVDVEKPVISPTFFESVSPFGTRRKRGRKLWAGLLAIVGLTTLVILGYFLYLMQR